jgi:glycosyltransferase involved in cell wall biosynthesis
MKSRLKIGLSIWMFKPGTGGLQSHAEHLARHLIARGHDVTVITKAFTKVPERLEFLYFSENPDSGEVGGVPVRTVNYSPRLRPLHWFIAKAKDKVGLKNLALSLYRRQAKIGNDKLYRGFDIIHHVGQATALLGFAAADGARKWRTPFVVQPTCHPYQIGDAPLDLKLYRLADRALVHTNYEAAHLRPLLGAMPIDVVGNGIEDRTDGVGERFREQHGIDGPMILYIGRRDADKGYGHVTRAFRLVKQKQPNATLVCMGPAGGVEKVEEPGILNFDFVEEQTKHDALAACDCLCVPSEGESFGLVYMEAGRYAKPVIARRLPVLEELLENGKAGLLVGRANPAKNENRLEPEELSDQILHLIQNPRLAAKIGEECRRVSEEFIWAKVVKRFEHAYSRSC